MVPIVLALYANMAPVKDYLMPKSSEVALARSAAPRSISDNATVLVLGPRGYYVAVSGSNGFVCLVERGWIAAFDWPQYWNPKIHAADCLNPPAARSLVPVDEMKTRLFLVGDSKSAANTLEGLPPLRVFVIGTNKWSDGSAVSGSAFESTRHHHQ